jgi:predicted transcriptional regulator YdeE
MKQMIINLPEIKLVGISERTNNINEGQPSTAKIGPTVQEYMQGNIPAKIQNRVRPGVNFCAYTSYEPEKIIDTKKYDYNGDYTYFVGEVVSSFDNLASDLKTLVIPAQKYIKLTTPKGAIPGIVIDAWTAIWEMTSARVGEERSFIADFEVYDEDASDLQNAIVNIYIGIK